MKTLLLIFSIGFFYLFATSAGPSSKITAETDYLNYIQVDTKSKVHKAQQEYSFWSAKCEAVPHQYPYLIKMSAAKNVLFSHTGDVAHLTESTKLLEQANKMTNSTNAALLRNLARNYISEHRFDESRRALNKALKIGMGLSETEKMLFDVNMELGNYAEAEFYLNEIEDKYSFDYLIRRSKWEDHRGDLSEAIFKMELALAGAIAKNNSELIQWSVTNLADYYGHDGNIAKSYAYYLKALELDPSDAYAKKGIAWILFSHERDTDGANRILNTIKQYHYSPDYLLLQAEMAAYDDNVELEKDLMLAYSDMVCEEAYGKMYNKYNVMLYAEDSESKDEALAIAQQEVAMRPTAQSYSLLAWAQYQLGNRAIAMDIVEEHILDQTFEPEPLFIAAKILKQQSALTAQEGLKEELVGSIYELGPIAEQEILEL